MASKRSFSTIAQPKKIDEQRASITYRNINGNIEAHIPPQSQVHNEDYDRSMSTARQESKTKRRKQQKKKVSDEGFKARNKNNIRNS